MTASEQQRSPMLEPSDDAAKATDLRGERTLSHWGHSVRGSHTHYGAAMHEQESLIRDICEGRNKVSHWYRDRAKLKHRIDNQMENG